MISVIVGSVSPRAYAAGFFDSLFGGLFAPPKPQTDPYGNPAGERRQRPTPPVLATDAPPEAAYCVRLCDGRFYPISSSTKDSTMVRMCAAMCPATQTRVFHGSEIGLAKDSAGVNYAKLNHAFAYRTSIVPNCTCNGKDAFGLVPIDILIDPTLQAGDIVATAVGLKTFHGAKGESHRTADFTPTPASKVPGLRRYRLPQPHLAERREQALPRVDGGTLVEQVSEANVRSGITTIIDHQRLSGTKSK